MSWRFATTPKWIVRHVLVVAVVGATLWAGFWQLRRLDEKRDQRDQVEAQQHQPVIDIASVIPADVEVGDAAVEAVVYRPVTATGTYADDETVVVENRSYNGAPGGWVLTPLVLDDGTAVVVNRGFVGFDREGAVVAPPAPAGEVTVRGLLRESQERGSIGRVDPSGEELDVLARADIDRYQEQVEADLYPVYLQLEESDPPEPEPAAGEPQIVTLGPPETDLGPHLGYAVQWFIFSAIAAGGYLLLLRRVAKDSAKSDAAVAKADDLDHELEELLRSER
ncbi:MAG TPA: SURF1 family protein [Acidimicrobiales bacterium]